MSWLEKNWLMIVFVAIFIFIFVYAIKKRKLKEFFIVIGILVFSGVIVWLFFNINLKEIKTMVYLAIILLIFVNLILLPLILKELASRDLFFTFVKEGSAKAIMGAGGSGFQRFILQYKGYRLNNPNDQNTYDFSKEEWEVIEPPTSDSTSPTPKPNPYITFFGLTGVRWLGLPSLHTIHEYSFKWNSLEQSSEGEKTKDAGGGIYFIPYSKKIKHILLQEDVYYARVEAAEDDDFVPLDFDFTIRVKVKNPYKALFGPQEWLEMTWSKVIPLLREFISQNKWDDLAKRETAIMEKFNPLVAEEKISLLADCGIDVKEFKFLRIAPSGERGKVYEEAATQEFVAIQEAKRIKILAEAEKDRIHKVYGEIKDFNELGKMIRRLEALENAAKGASNTIISAPELAGLASTLQNIVGRRP